MVRYLYEDERVSRDEPFAVGAAFSWFELLFMSFTNLTSVGLTSRR